MKHGWIYIYIKNESNIAEKNEGRFWRWAVVMHGGMVVDLLVVASCDKR
jgi:hypothetical protein